MRKIEAALFVSMFLALGPRDLCAQKLDLARYEKLREEERYYYNLTEKAFSSKNMAAALNEFGKFLKLYPNLPASSFAKYMLGVCNERKRYVHTAIKEYQQTIDYYGDSPEAPLAQHATARCYEKIGEPEKAFPEYEKFLTDYPKHPLAADVLWHLSAKELKEGKGGKASERRKRIILEFPKHRLFRQAVEWMIRHQLFAEDDPVTARELCWRLRSKPETELYLASLYRKHAGGLLAKKNKTEGKEFMEKAIDIYRQFTIRFPKMRDKIPDCEFAIAGCLVALGDYKKAIETYQGFPQRHPWATRHFKTCVKSIIKIYVDREMSDHVRQWYRVFLDKWPGDDPARKEFGLYLESIEAWTDARDEYRGMQNKFDGRWEVASSFHRQEEADKAIEAYKRVAEDDFVRFQIAYYQIGQVYQLLKQDYEAAILAYNKSEYRPPTHMFRIAECYVALQKYPRALDTCREIINFFKKSCIPAMQFMVTQVYEKRKSKALKDRQNAIDMLRAIIRLFPNTGASSWAHIKLEDYGVVVTGGGVSKGKE